MQPQAPPVEHPLAPHGPHTHHCLASGCPPPRLALEGLPRAAAQRRHCGNASGPTPGSGARQRCMPVHAFAALPAPRRALPACPMPTGGSIKNFPLPQSLLRCCCLLVRWVTQALLISLRAEALPLCVITLLGSCLPSASCCAEPLPPIWLLNDSSSPASQGLGAGDCGGPARRRVTAARLLHKRCWGVGWHCCCRATARPLDSQCVALAWPMRGHCTVTAKTLQRQLLHGHCITII